MCSTGLLQVAPSDLSRPSINELDASLYNNLQQVCRSQVATSLISDPQNLLQFDEVKRLAGTC